MRKSDAFGFFLSQNPSFPQPFFQDSKSEFRVGQSSKFYKPFRFESDLLRTVREQNPLADQRRSEAAPPRLGRTVSAFPFSFSESAGDAVPRCDILPSEMRHRPTFFPPRYDIEDSQPARARRAETRRGKLLRGRVRRARVMPAGIGGGRAVEMLPEVLRKRLGRAESNTVGDLRDRLGPLLQQGGGALDPVPPDKRGGGAPGELLQPPLELAGAEAHLGGEVVHRE